MKAPHIVVGIDVGGARKGFHAVALLNGKFLSTQATTQVGDLVDWCHQIKAQTIAVDAPAYWSVDERGRPAERELMSKGIRCFSSPTRKNALAHPKNYFGWMLCGEALFRALQVTHPLCRELPTRGRRCCFETFPHAITWHLTQGKADASIKRTQRRALLKRVGIDYSQLSNIDLIDAALCAYAAHHVATQKPCTAYGQVSSGLLIVPRG